MKSPIWPYRYYQKHEVDVKIVFWNGLVKSRFQPGEKQLTACQNSFVLKLHGEKPVFFDILRVFGVSWNEPFFEPFFSESKKLRSIYG